MPATQSSAIRYRELEPSASESASVSASISESKFPGFSDTDSDTDTEADYSSAGKGKSTPSLWTPAQTTRYSLRFAWVSSCFLPMTLGVQRKFNV